MEENKLFRMFGKDLAKLTRFSDEECGRIIKAVISDFLGDPVELDDPGEAFAADTLIECNRRLDEASQTRSENGKKGGAPAGNRNAAKADNNAVEDVPENNLETTKTTENNLNQAKTTKNNQKQPKTSSNTSTSTNTSTKERKKESPAGVGGYDRIIDGYTDNEALRSELREFVKMRKLAKSVLTDHALESICKKIDALASSDSDRILIVRQSIENGWKGVFPLKQKPQAVSRDAPPGNDEMMKRILSSYDTGQGGDSA